MTPTTTRTTTESADNILDLLGPVTDIGKVTTVTDKENVPSGVQTGVQAGEVGESEGPVGYRLVLPAEDGSSKTIVDALKAAFEDGVIDMRPDSEEPDSEEDEDSSSSRRNDREDDDDGSSRNRDRDSEDDSVSGDEDKNRDEKSDDDSATLPTLPDIGPETNPEDTSGKGVSGVGESIAITGEDSTGQNEPGDGTPELFLLNDDTLLWEVDGVLLELSVDFKSLKDSDTSGDKSEELVINISGPTPSDGPTPGDKAADDKDSMVSTETSTESSADSGGLGLLGIQDSGGNDALVF